MRSRTVLSSVKSSEKQSFRRMVALSALLLLPWIGACSRISTTVLQPEKPVPQIPVVAMQPCPPILPILREDLEEIWMIDPSRVPREVLENEIIQGELYRNCVRKHEALRQWVLETTRTE
jgi:hypothetical protein